MSDNLTDANLRRDDVLRKHIPYGIMVLVQYWHLLFSQH